MLEDALVTCPYCWEEVEISIDLSAGSHTLVEDCPVCCQPMTVRIDVGDDGCSHTVNVEAENR